LRDCPLGNPIQQQHSKRDQQRAFGHEMILLGGHFLFPGLVFLWREEDFT
jgi:hypothetical protein